MQFTVKRSGNTFIASGESCRGFGSSEDQALRRWESMVQSDVNAYAGRPHQPKRVLQHEGAGDDKGIALRKIKRNNRVSQGSDRTVEETVTVGAALRS